ncbi:hypothetical protein [Methylomonas albis]|nr:hypothetical protein [Methylomonas albis]
MMDSEKQFSFSIGPSRKKDTSHQHGFATSLLAAICQKVLCRCSFTLNLAMKVAGIKNLFCDDVFFRALDL